MHDEADQKTTAEEFEYHAFISYSHGDDVEEHRRWATWLRDQIEQFTIPPSLNDTGDSEDNPVPGRIGTVFLDADSMAAAPGLTGALKHCLDKSKYLLVLCSPRSAASDYVSKEIEYFQSLGRDRQILTVLLEGSARDRSYPRPIRERAREAGDNPFSADFRSADGSMGFTSEKAHRKHLIKKGLTASQAGRRARAYSGKLRKQKLKIIAGLLGVSLDVLSDRVQRHELAEARKRNFRLTVALVTISVFGLLAVLASIVAWERSKASFRARMDAEGLTAFMITELNQDLLEIGRTGVIDRVLERVDQYYRGKNEWIEFPQSAFLDGLASLKRSHNLEAMGDLEESMKQVNYALSRFQMLREAGDLPFIGGGSDFHVTAYEAIALVQKGGVFLKKGRFDRAGGCANSAVRLAQSLQEEFPENVTALSANRQAHELLGKLANWRCRGRESVRIQKQSVRLSEKIARLSPDSLSAKMRLAGALSLLSNAQRVTGDMGGARESALQGLALLQNLEVEAQTNALLSEQIAGAHFSVGTCYVTLGHIEAAEKHLRLAKAEYGRLTGLDKNNKEWLASEALVDGLAVDIALFRGDTGKAREISSRYLSERAGEFSNQNLGESQKMLYHNRLAEAYALEENYTDAAGQFSTAIGIAGDPSLQSKAFQAYVCIRMKIPYLDCLIKLGRGTEASELVDSLESTWIQWKENGVSRYQIDLLDACLSMQKMALDRITGETASSKTLSERIHRIEEYQATYPDDRYFPEQLARALFEYANSTGDNSYRKRALETLSGLETGERTLSAPADRLRKKISAQ